MNYHDVYFPGEDEEVLRRIGEACIRHPISLDEILKSAEFVAVCTSYGLLPRDVLYDGVKAYPHLMEMMSVVWDVEPIAGDLEGNNG